MIIKVGKCDSCDTLRAQLEIANAEKKQLLETILEFTRPVAREVPVNIKEIEPIRPKGVPWRVRQSKLEAESRVAARIKEEHERQIRELEEEVGVDDASEKRETV